MDIVVICMGHIKANGFVRGALWLALLLPLFAAPALGADATAWIKTPQTEVRLIAGQAGAGDEGVVRLGLHFKLKDGWKIYWRRPGDAGFPPRLILSSRI